MSEQQPQQPQQRRRTMRFRIAVAVIVLLAACASPAAAQGGVAEPVRVGRFRGVVDEPDPQDVRRDMTRAVTGVARWRHELDSLDWRVKLTVRVTLDAPERGILIGRAEGQAIPQGAVIVHAHYRQDYAPATVAEVLPVAGSARWAENLMSYGDSVVLEPLATPGPSSVVRGHLRIGGYPRTSPVLRSTDKVRFVHVTGDFAAVFDPRSTRVPTTMSDSMQAEILKRALWDANARWLDGMQHIRANDSSFDNTLLRAYLANRWSHVATIEAVQTDYKKLYVRLRGKLAPVVCGSDDGRLQCASARSWVDRLRGKE